MRHEPDQLSGTGRMRELQMNKHLPIPMQEPNYNHAEQLANEIETVVAPQPKKDSSENEMLKLMMTLNDSVKNMASRFDKFEATVNMKVARLEGEMLLMKNKVNMIQSHVGTSAPTPAFEMQSSITSAKASELKSVQISSMKNSNALKETSFGTREATNPFATQLHSEPAAVQASPPVINDSVQLTDDIIARVQARLNESNQMLQG